MRGYYTNTGKKQYVLITEKKCVNVYMITAFLRKIAETEGITDDKLTAVLTDRQAMAEMRKRIEPCTIDKFTDEFGEYYNVAVGKLNPTFTGNFYVKDGQIITFTEAKGNPHIAEIFG